MSGLGNKYALTKVRTLPTWTSNGKVFTPDADATDIEVIGAGDLNYNGFPDLEIDTNNDLYLIYSNSDSHDGGDPGSGTLIQKSTDAGQTWGATVKVVDIDVDPIGGPTFLITENRIITFHTDFADILGNGVRRHYFRNFDKSFVMQTDFTHMTADFPNPGQVVGPGKGIRHRGKYLKPVYCRPAATGNRGIYIYIAESETAPVWTLHGVISPGVSDDFEEPYLAEMANGILVCAIKSDSLNYSLWSYSLDGGVRWSQMKFLFNSEGKNVIVCSPSGTMLAVGRQFPSTDWRTMYTSSPGNGIWQTEAYADERTSMYMYGGGVWHPGINKAIVAYSTDSNFPNGPAKIIIKYFTESTI